MLYVKPVSRRIHVVGCRGPTFSSRPIMQIENRNAWVVMACPQHNRPSPAAQRVDLAFEHLHLGHQLLERRPFPEVGLRTHANRPRPVQSTSPQPFSHLLPDLTMGYGSSSIRLLDASLDLCHEQQPFHDIFYRTLFGELLYSLNHSVLCCHV